LGSFKLTAVMLGCTQPETKMVKNASPQRSPAPELFINVPLSISPQFQFETVGYCVLHGISHLDAAHDRHGLRVIFAPCSPISSHFWLKICGKRMRSEDASSRVTSSEFGFLESTGSESGYFDCFSYVYFGGLQGIRAERRNAARSGLLPFGIRFGSKLPCRFCIRFHLNG